MANQALVNIDGNAVPTLEIIMMLTIIALIPTIVMMMSCFPRIIITLSFLRNALGIQQSPPNMVLAGLALFLTLFIMNPVMADIKENAYEPYARGEIKQEEVLMRAAVPMKDFMLRQTEDKTLSMFMEMSGTEAVEHTGELPMTVVISSFMTSEIKRAFIAGFLIYLPFLLIDIITSSTLMSMGMVMLPPTMISLPFKILLFVTVDGWNLLFSSIVKSFN